MAKKTADDKVVQLIGEDARQRSAGIGKAVLDSLGTPGNLHRVQVRPLWDDYFRVNVLVGEDFVQATVAHSFFLHADDAGVILQSTPAITRHYQLN